MTPLDRYETLRERCRPGNYAMAGAKAGIDTALPLEMKLAVIFFARSIYEVAYVLGLLVVKWAPVDTRHPLSTP